MSDQTQNVSVKLKLDIDKEAPRAFQTFARELQKANKEVVSELKKAADAFKTQQDRNYRNAGTSGLLGQSELGSRIAGNTNRAAGLERMGFEKGAAMLSKAAVPLAIAAQVIEKTVKLAEFAANTQYDRYSTNEQNQRKAFRELVPFGERLQKSYDTFTGRGYKMEEAGIQGQIQSAYGASVNDADAYRLSHAPGQAGRAAVAQTYAGQSAVMPGTFDRSTALGERGYREDQRAIPYKQAVAKAERDAAQASAERLTTQKELAKLEQRGTALRSQAGRLESQLLDSRYGSGPEREAIEQQLKATNAALGGNASLRRSAAESLVGAKQREAGASGELSKAGIRSDKLLRADILESRADTAAGTASAIGGMNPYERQFALQSMKNGEQYGWDALPPEAQAAFMAIAPERAQKARQAAGEGSAVYRELGTIAPELAPGRANDLRAQATTLRQEAAQGEFSVDSSVAKQSSAAGKDLGAYIGNIIVEQFDTAKSEIFRTVRQGVERTR